MGRLISSGSGGEVGRLISSGSGGTAMWVAGCGSVRGTFRRIHHGRGRAEFGKTNGVGPAGRQKSLPRTPLMYSLVSFCLVFPSM